MTFSVRLAVNRSFSPFVTTYATAAAAFIVYLVTTAPDIYWLDSNEFVAAGFTLGIPHPPGHPLHVVFSKLLSLIPLGSVAFRINLLSALLGAAAVSGISGIITEILQRFRPNAAELHVTGPVIWLRSTLIFLVSMFAALSPGLWLQSVRAEVYTLQAALVIWAAVVILRWHRQSEDSSSSEPTSLAPVALCAWLVALGLTNHHYLMILFAPSVLCIILVTKGGVRLLLSRKIALVIAVGLSALLHYCYLPIRARAESVLNWADPSTPERFFASVTAQVFQTSITDPVSRNVIDNLLDQYFLLMYQLHPSVVVLGTAGIALCWNRSWKTGLFISVALLGNLLSTALMHFDAANPDAWGYLQFSTLLMTALCGVLLIVAVEDIVLKWPQRIALVAILAVITCAGVVFRQVQTHHSESNLSDFRAAELFQDHLFQNSPPGSLVFASYYTVTFNYWNTQFTDGRRPDITFVQQTFDAKLYQGKPYVESLLKRFPDFSDIFLEFIQFGRFPTSGVLKRSDNTPVLLEPDATLPIRVNQIVGVGAQTTVVTAPHSGYSEKQREFCREWWKQLSNALGNSKGRTRETDSVLLWHHLHLAILYLRQAEPSLAGFHVELALTINPESAEFRRLHALVSRMTTLPDREQKQLALELQNIDLSNLLGP